MDPNLALFRRQPLIDPGLWPGFLVALLLMSFCLLLLGTLGFHSRPLVWFAWYHDPYWHQIWRFTFLQASLSTLLSLVIAFPLSSALSRRRFVGRQCLLQLFTLSVVLPTVVAVFGLVTLYGRKGWLAHFCSWMGLDYSVSLYGLPGIILVHIFFNVPLTTHLFFYQLRSQPLASIRLAAQLGMNCYQRFWWVEWPRIRASLPAVSGVIFSLCINNLTSSLLLGGNPQTTSLSLAIYQSIQEVEMLGQLFPVLLLQFVGCLIFYLLCHYCTHSQSASTLISDTLANCRGLWQDSAYLQLWDTLWILLGIGIVLLPIVAVVISGFNSLLALSLKQPALWQSLGYSLLIGTASALVAVTLGATLLFSSSHLSTRSHRHWLVSCGLFIAFLPPFAIAMALLYLFRGSSTSWQSGGLIVITNGLIAIPYVIKVLAVPLESAVRQSRMLCQGLGIQGLNRWRLIYAPLLYRYFSFAIIVSLLLSLGEIGIFALFGHEGYSTLSRYLYQQLSTYHYQEAAVSALLLLVSCFVLLIVSKSLIHHDHSG